MVEDNEQVKVTAEYIQALDYFMEKTVEAFGHVTEQIKTASKMIEVRLQKLELDLEQLKLELKK